MSQGNAVDRQARRDLHEHILGVHEALDRLEADGGLTHIDYLLAGAETLFLNGAARFDQLRYCVDTYGRPTPPPVVPVSSKAAA